MRVAMGVEYDGAGFYGWQTQAQEPTVQACIERALSRVADRPVTIMGAGRTDTGVHARAQVFHFDTPVERPMRAWVLGGNSHLPPGISLLWAQPVGDEFHARFSAQARTYRYRILDRWTRPALQRGKVAWCHRRLDAGRMHAAAESLIGEHDFTSFRAVACQAPHARRRIDRLEVTRRDELVVIDITANAFLHHMVRNIAGSLMAVGGGERPASWIAEVLAARDRRRAGPTGPAAGLELHAIHYPARFALPEGTGPAFPAEDGPR